MLQFKPIRSVKGDSDRRWLSDEYFDLIVWYDSMRRIQGFQLCYDKLGRERAFTWKARCGYSHAAIDGGELKPTANRTPILVPDVSFPLEEVRCEFLARSLLLPFNIRDLVSVKLADYEKRHRVAGFARLFLSASRGPWIFVLGSLGFLGIAAISLRATRRGKPL